MSDKYDAYLDPGLGGFTAPEDWSHPEPVHEHLAEPEINGVDNEQAILTASFAELNALKVSTTAEDNPLAKTSAPYDLYAAMRTLHTLNSLGVSGEYQRGDFRGDVTSIYSQARHVIVSLLDQYTDRWGFPSSNTTATLTQVEHSQERAIQALLGILARNFGLIHIDVQVGDEFRFESMERHGNKVARNGQKVNAVAEVIRAGFANNEGQLWRKVSVYTFTSEQARADADLRRNQS